MILNPADCILYDLDTRDHLRVIWDNNPLCLAWRQLILDNSPRGTRPNNNPSEMDDVVAGLAALTERLKLVGKLGRWDAAAEYVAPEMMIPA